jgi:uncharacterized protein YcbK (DUF882 family)
VASSAHFSDTELACPCCGVNGVTQRGVDLLEDVRSIAGLQLGMDSVRLTIKSGFRCEEHNIKIGGAKNSQHMAGTAADAVLQVKQGKAGKWVNVPVSTFEQIARRSKLLGGIGRDDERGFVHIDARPKAQATPAQWCYKGGKEVAYYPAVPAVQST